MSRPTTRATAGTRPHVLLVMADQWPASALGCYGSPVPDVSPAVDRLAVEGVLFERHHTPIPLCGPSRAALFTGSSPLASGCVANDVEPRPHTPFVSALLAQAGYRTFGAGKFHVSSLRRPPPTDLTHLGFQDIALTEDPKHGAWLDWVRTEHPDHYEQALAVSWPMPYLDDPGPDGAPPLRAAWEDAYRRHLEPLQQPPHRRIVHPSPLPAELHQSTWITDRALEALDRAAAGRDPAFTFVSYVDPHDPYDPPEPYWSAADPGAVPPAVPQEWTREASPWQYREFVDTRFELSTFTEATWALLRGAYYAGCRFVDDQIGRLLDGLEERGLAQDTLVVVTSDHGELAGDHGLLMKGPWHYDATTRCPMVVRGPGVAQGARFAGLTSHLDVLPTLLAAAGVEHGPTEGRPLPLTAARLAQDPGHEHLVVETNTSYLADPDPVRTLLTADGHRLTLFPGQEYGELFDLRADPQEQVNHYPDPAWATRREGLTRELVGALAEQSVATRRRPR